MPVRDTSLCAYDALRDTDMLQKREREVMLAVWSHYPNQEKFTRKELARAIGWEINRVTGRVLTLIDKKYLHELNERRDGSYLLQIRPAQLSLLEAA